MTPRGSAAAAASALALAALAYAALALVAVRRFERRGHERAETLPDVSILVPLHGDEPGLAENLRAFVAQDAPGVQVVAGVGAPDDTARAVAEAVAAALPAHRFALSVGRDPDARNPKVANLIAMRRLARGRVLVLVDSDMRVDPAYVRSVVAPLADPAVGAVTCLYAGVPDARLPSRLGAMFISEQFAPSALVERLFGPLRHAFGATIALRAEVLDRVGGFEALAPHLADDHVLGRTIAGAGFRVHLSRYVVRTLVYEDGWRGLWRHELRWHRTIRARAPGGYAGMFLTYPLPLALAAFALAPGRPTLLLAVAAFALRAALGRAASRALGVMPETPLLIPLRDAVGIAVWAAGLGGGAVRWRDAALQIERGDALRATASRPPS